MEILNLQGSKYTYTFLEIETNKKLKQIKN